MSRHITRIRVRYAETDQMGVVYYGNYLVWMEVARVEYCTSIGFRYRDMEDHDGIVLAVIEARCRYLKPARFDDEIEIATSISEANRRFAAFHYDFRCDGQQIAVGQTRHIFLTRQMRPVKLSDKYCKFFDVGSHLRPIEPTHKVDGPH